MEVETVAIRGFKLEVQNLILGQIIPDEPCGSCHVFWQPDKPKLFTGPLQESM